jgi:uroporphyrinogen decarboxylase
MNVNAKERLIAALDRRSLDRIPSFEWFIDSQVGETLTGSCDPLDIVAGLDLDGINVRPDYTREQLAPDTYQDEWGIVRRETGDCIAAVIQSPLVDINQHEAYQFPDPDASQRFKTLARAQERLGHERALILNLRDGFSDMRDILGYENALMSCMADADRFREFLDRSVDYNLALARRAKQEFDVEVVATTDDVATAQGLLMGPQVYFDVIGPAFQRVIRGYKDMGFKVIKHCDGDCSVLIDFWIEAGIDCLDPVDPEAGFDMAEFKAQYGSKICLKGNIDCKGALQYGTPEEVEAEVQACIQKGGAGSGLILSSSNTIHRGVKPENYRAMLTALRKHGSY